MKIICADLFCGAGGTSSGLIEASRELGVEIELVAINHWPVAVATHTQNHPWAKHICARIEEVRPREVFPGGRLHLLVASPECTHHSIARGGRPVEDQKRVPAWGVIHWAQELYIDSIIIENVPEFASWGPVGVNGKPLKSRKGETYQAFLQALRSLGYRLEERVLCCADYGDATTRKRLFIVATRQGSPTWPLPTHAAKYAMGQNSLFHAAPLKPWRAAHEIIDWGLQGKNIFDRKKPLAVTTLRRIAAGMRTINGIEIEPYLLSQSSGGPPRTVSDLVPNVCASSPTEPFLIGAGGPARAAEPRSIEKPVQTVLTRQSIAMVEPFLVAAGGPKGKGRTPKDVEGPLDTVLTENHQALVRPFLVTVNHKDESTQSGTGRCQAVDVPMPALTCKNGLGIVDPFLLPHQHGNDTEENIRSVDKPMPTVTATSSDMFLVEPYIAKYYGTGVCQAIGEPLDSVTTRDRFGLVEPRLIPIGKNLHLGIRFRMLQPHELAAAQGFPNDYKFMGNKSTKVKQIGNAVPHFTAKALCRERLKRYAC